MSTASSGPDNTDATGTGESDPDSPVNSADTPSPDRPGGGGDAGPDASPAGPDSGTAGADSGKPGPEPGAVEAESGPEPSDADADSSPTDTDIESAGATGPGDSAEPAPPASSDSPDSPAASVSRSPEGDRPEPGGVSAAGDESAESTSSEVHSPTAMTPELGMSPPSDRDNTETTPGRSPDATDLEWAASMPADELSAAEWVRPVTAVPSESLPIPMPPVTRAPLGSAFGYPARFANAPGTGYHLALPQLGTIVAGSAIGSLIAGIGAAVVAVGAACSLFLGPLVSAASSVLAVFCAGAAILLAGLGMRQIRRGAGEFRGTGMAITGLCCAGLAIIMALFVFLVLLLR